MDDRFLSEGHRPPRTLEANGADYSSQDDWAAASEGLANGQAARLPEDGSRPPAVKAVNLRDLVARQTGRAPEGSLASSQALQAEISALPQRVGKLETKAAHLERFERQMSDAQTATQASFEQLQSVGRLVQELSGELKIISRKLEGTLGYGIYDTSSVIGAAAVGRLQSCSSAPAVVTATGVAGGPRSGARFEGVNGCVEGSAGGTTDAKGSLGQDEVGI